MSPVTARGATRREVYLPAGADWYDFWTGERLEGGRRISAPAPYDSLPVHVRAGSILPLGPELGFTDEKPADPLTLWVYTGADGEFELYEDDGVSTRYEEGELSTIPLAWRESTGTLTIGERAGSFPGMLREREIRVVFVSPEVPVGHTPAVEGARTVAYDGGAVTLAAP